MPTNREVMQMALDALEDTVVGLEQQVAIDALRAELAKPEPEPVAWINARGDYCEVSRPGTVYGSHTIPLYRKDGVWLTHDSALPQGWCMTKRELLQMALEALVETTGLATNYEAVKEKGGHEFADALMVIELGNVVIATLRAELAKTEPDTIAWACWLEDADPATDTPQLCTYEPMAYRQRIPLIRKDDL